MALNLVNIGAAPNDGTGDPARTAFGKVNAAIASVSSQSYNVKDYGAVGNGVADDGPAWQSVLDAVNSAGGGVVIAPFGVYIVRNLRVYSNTTLILNGVTLKYGGSQPIPVGTPDNQPGVLRTWGTSSSPASNVTIIGGEIIANRPSGVWDMQGGTEGDDAVQFTWTNHIRIVGTKVSDVGQDGVEVKDCLDVTIENCVFRDIADAAIELRNGGNIRIRNNRFIRVRNAVMSKPRANHVQVTDNYIEAFHDAIGPAVGSDWVVRGNTILPTTTPDGKSGVNFIAISVIPHPVDAPSDWNMTGWQVRDNTIRGWTGGQAIGFATGSGAIYRDLHVTGNRISSCGIGIVVVGECVVAGNFIESCTTSGISCGVRGAVSIAHNVIVGTLDPIRLNGQTGGPVGTTGDGVSIVGNRISGCTGRGINFTTVRSTKNSKTSIVGNRVEATVVGIDLGDALSSDTQICDNYVICSGGDGILVTAPDCAVSGNRVVTGTAGAGINCLATAGRMAAFGNRVSTSTSNSSGILVAADDCVVGGNVVTNYNHGIRAQAARTTINGNRCRDQAFDGVHITSAATATLVVGNHLQNVGRDGVHNLGATTLIRSNIGATDSA